MAKNGKATAIGGEAPSNGAAATIALSEPYTVMVKIQGSADILFHRWNVEGVEAKASAAKGSKAKKTDDIESYVYRNVDGMLCLPGEYLRQAVIHAAKYRQDPRSPRKSAMDLFKAGCLCLTQLASLGKKEWDYEDRRRVVIQRNAVTRVRPAMLAGWGCEVQLMVQTPEYIPPAMLLEVLNTAGRLIGVGDFRPTFGRFGVTSFDIGLE
jgi:hypothetical protein